LVDTRHFVNLINNDGVGTTELLGLVDGFYDENYTKSIYVESGHRSETANMKQEANYIDCLADVCVRYLNKPLAHSIFCEPFTAPELSRLITNLNTSKSPGADNLSPKLIKDIAPAILEPLLYIFNFSLTSGAVPAAMKLAKVIPVLKKRRSSATWQL
jgi:hypothetical protein